MIIPLFQIDAFAERLFEGNPAAVCVLEQGWLPECIMQRIAAENNLSETAFLAPGRPGRWQIRWFTPKAEVELCGHATLASAHVVFNYLARGSKLALFDSPSGELAALLRTDSMIELDFPARIPLPLAPPAGLASALGLAPSETLSWRDWLLAVYPSEHEIRRLKPDMAALSKLDFTFFSVTAYGSEFDFVSRFFAPKAGVDEDPVTGAAHCLLAPFWAARLEKDSLEALQLSQRGGRLSCELRADRVAIAGRTVKFAEGFIEF